MGRLTGGIVDGVGTAVDGEEGEEAEAGVAKEGEAFVDAGVSEVGDGGLVHVRADVEAIDAIGEDGIAVAIVLGDAGVAEIDGVAEPGAEGLAEGAEGAGGGCGVLHVEGVVEEVLGPGEGELRKDAEGDGGVGVRFEETRRRRRGGRGRRELWYGCSGRAGSGAGLGVDGNGLGEAARGEECGGRTEGDRWVNWLCGEGFQRDLRWMWSS
jgi:hypothetical protein